MAARSTAPTINYSATYEYRFSPEWSATVAGSQEKQANGGSDFSPRLALLFSPDATQTFRMVYSEAVRTPDLYENDLNWNYVATQYHTRGFDSRSLCITA